MNNLSSIQIGVFHIDWMVVALIGLLLGIGILFLIAQRDAENPIDIRDLVMEDGKLSKIACVMMGSFTVTTWMMINLTLNGKMTEGYLVIYGGLWVSPVVTRIIKGPQPREQGATQ